MTKKEIIIQKSAELFMSKGFAACSVRDIAAAAGIEPSSLYSHIRSKEELLFVICMQCAEHYNSAIDLISGTSIDTVELFSEIIDIHIDLALNDPTSSTVFSDEWKNLPTDMKDKFLKEKKEYEAKFLRIIKQLQMQGKIKKIEAYVLLNTIISAVRWVHYSKKKRTKKEKEDLKRQVKEIIFKGIIN